MSLNLSKPKVLKVIVEAGEFNLRLPNMAIVKVFQNELDKAQDAGGGAAIVCIQNLLEKLGMPQKVSDELDMEQMEAIIGGLIPKKKD